jgi:uncharacterized membrane protein YhiD involved in acid resistance
LEKYTLTEALRLWCRAAVVVAIGLGFIRLLAGSREINSFARIAIIFTHGCHRITQKRNGLLRLAMARFWNEP